MKNIKLLLATTAILSTGLATGVMADGYAIEIKPKVTMVSAVRAVNTDINFGKVAWNRQGGETVIVTAIPNGLGNDLDVTPTGTATHFGGASSGLINLNDESLDTPYYYSPDQPPADAYDIVFPDEPITLKGTDKESNEVPCGTVASFTKATGLSGYGYGATFTTAARTNGSHVPLGGMECTGTGEITLVPKTE